MELPDPYDADWETCLAAYRQQRAATMANCYRVQQALARLEDRIEAIEERGGPTEQEDRELTDRLRMQNFLQIAARHQLMSMRRYLDLVRVVHRRADRETYELIFYNARELGIPPYITRQMVDAGTSRNN